MKNITRIGVDLAKNIFQLCLTDEQGRVVNNIRLKRPGYWHLSPNNLRARSSWKHVLPLATGQDSSPGSALGSN
jgi:hypothetical protein